MVHCQVGSQYLLTPEKRDGRSHGQERTERYTVSSPSQPKQDEQDPHQTAEQKAQEDSHNHVPAQHRPHKKCHLHIPQPLSLIHISEPTRRTPISYAVFCLKKKKKHKQKN